MQNVFPPLLSVQKTQQSHQASQMASQLEQESPPNLDLQMLMSQLEAQQGSTSTSNGLQNQLFEAIFAQALSQANQQPQPNNLNLAQSSDQSSPPASTALAEDTSTVVSTPTSAAAPVSLQSNDEDAAKLLAQLMREGSASLLQQLPGQSQQTSPNLQDASTTLLEQLQFMGLFNGSTQPTTEQSNEWKNASMDFASLLGSQNMINPVSTQSSQQQRPAAQSDAYCEICNKQLCNRYFLRTHMLKKHGVEPPSTTIAPTAVGSFAPLQALQSPLKRDGDWSKIEPSTPNRLSDHDILFAHLTDPPTKMPRLAPISTQFNVNAKEEQHSPLKSPNAVNINTQNTARFTCDTCDKDFDSMSNLLQHQIQNHQQITGFQPLLMQQQVQNQANGNQTPISSPSGHQTPHQQTPSSQQHTPNQNNMLNQLLPGLQLPPAFQLPPLFNFGNLSSTFPFSGNNDLDVARMAQQLGATNGRLPTIPTTQAPKTPKRQYTSTSKNFCDLCNKEVCNKYFLRTHMLKMHNIIIDENKSVIANIDTVEKEKEGGISFRCDYCKIKFDTRQQLRDHKREVHNIAPSHTNHISGMATASSASSDCDTSSKTPNSSNAPLNSFFGNSTQTSNMSNHEQMDPSSSASSTAGTAGSTMTSCHYCPESFPDQNKLNHHLMTSHYQELMTELMKSQQDMDEDELINQVAMQMARSNQLEKVKENQKNVTYKCTHCQREYMDANKFNDHLQLHMAAKKFSPKKNKRKVMAPQKFKKSRQTFTCIKCQRRFNNRIECQNHVRAHLREQKLSNEEHQTKPEDENQIDDEELLNSYMHEDEEYLETNFRCSAVDEVVEQAHQAFQKSRNSKEEKHSHTSGSASPSSTHHLAEGFFQPLNGSTNTASDKFNYQTQSFVMRVASEQSDVIQDVCDQLLGTLPVRQLISRPFRLTFEFQPLSEEASADGVKNSVVELQTADV